MAEPLPDRQCAALAAQAIHRLTCTASRMAAACDGPTSRDFELAHELAAIISAAERERCASLAESVGATYRSTYSFTEGRSKVLRFADLIRLEPDNG